MRPFVLNEVLENLVRQLREESSKEKKNKSLTEELGELTKTKRCLIVLDDLSSVVEWDRIQSLLKIENASRIVITTREENIAKHCSKNEKCIYKLQVLNPTEALHLFTKKVLLQ